MKKWKTAKNKYMEKTVLRFSPDNLAQKIEITVFSKIQNYADKWN